MTAVDQPNDTFKLVEGGNTSSSLLQAIVSCALSNWAKYIVFQQRCWKPAATVQKPKPAQFDSDTGTAASLRPTAGFKFRRNTTTLRLVHILLVGHVAFSTSRSTGLNFKLPLVTPPPPSRLSQLGLRDRRWGTAHVLGQCNKLNPSWVSSGQVVSISACSAQPGPRMPGG
jgi:hypothetical protein